MDQNLFDFLKNIARALPTGIELFDKAGKLLYANTASLELFGVLDFEDIVGTDLFKYPTLPESIRNQLRQGKVVIYEHQFDFEEVRRKKWYPTTKSGAIFLQVLIAPLYFGEGNLLGYVSRIQEITESKLTEVALQESEEKYRNLIENINEVIYQIAPDGTIRYLSPRIKEFSGYEPSELIGKPFRILIYPEDVPRIMEQFQRILSGTSTSNDYRVISKTGDLRWMRTSTKPLFKGDQVIGVQGLLIDITEQKHAVENLRESEERYRLITENANDLILILNQRKEIEFLNKKSEVLLGYDPQKVLGNVVLNYIHPDDIKATTEAFDSTFQEGTGMVESRIKTKDGNYVVVESRGQSFIDGTGNAKLLVISRDITARRKFEEDLQASEEKYRSAYNRADFYKDLFAHDINNILQNILSSVEVCDLYLNEPEKQNRVKYMLSIVKEQVERGATLVKNIHKLSEMEEAEIRLIKVDALEALEQAIAHVQEGHPQKAVKLEIVDCPTTCFVVANELLLDMFENLLENAIKHNRNSSILINIKISELRKDDKNYYRFEIQDNGTGIPDSMKDFIFQRGTYEKRSVRGRGLGLSLVNQIVKNYQGTIRVENRVKDDYSQGSNFIIEILGAN